MVESIRSLRPSASVAAAIARRAFTSVRRELDPRVYVVRIPLDPGKESECEDALRGDPALPISLKGATDEVARRAPSLEPYASIRANLASDEFREMNRGSGRWLALRDTVQERLNQLPDVDVRRRIASGGETRGDALVGAVIDLDLAAFNRTERFAVPPAKGPGRVSLVRALEDVVMRSVATELRDAHPYRAGGMPWSEDLLRDAAGDVLRALGFEMYARSILETMTAIAAATHEGRACSGRIGWIETVEAESLGAVILAQPIRFDRDHVDVLRKLLVDVTGDDTLGCWEIPPSETGGFPAFGATSVCAAPSTSPFVQMRFHSGARWDVRVDETRVLEVRGGFVALPGGLFKEEFLTALARVFPSESETDGEFLWDIVDCAVAAGGGGVVVVAADAAAIVASNSTGFACTPRSVTPERIARLAHIDGAVLLDTTARLHGFGVILDGANCGEERRERGARFNSAMRFVAAARGKRSVLAVVISSDGATEVLEATTAALS